MGIAIGDVVVTENGDLLGNAVNVAARLERLAEPGSICISDDVRAPVMNKIELSVVDLRRPEPSQHSADHSGLQGRIECHGRCRGAARKGRGRRSFCRDPGDLAGFRNRRLRPVRASLPRLVPVSSRRNSEWICAEQPFDPTRVPLVSDRVRESLADYEQEADYKAIAISREGWGVALGASDTESARREALDRCRPRDREGIAGSTPSGTRFGLAENFAATAGRVHADPLASPSRPISCAARPGGAGTTPRRVFEREAAQGAGDQRSGFSEPSDRASKPKQLGLRASDAPMSRARRVYCCRLMAF